MDTFRTPEILERSRLARDAVRTAYFIAADEVGRVKIGQSQNFEKRFVQLQGASPVILRLVRTFVGNTLLELQFHRMFAEYRLHGEWFRFEGLLRAFVEDPASQPPDDPAYRWLKSIYVEGEDWKIDGLAPMFIAELRRIRTRPFKPDLSYAMRSLQSGCMTVSEFDRIINAFPEAWAGVRKYMRACPRNEDTNLAA